MSKTPVNSWKSRSTYGSILYRKIKKLNKKFNNEINSEQSNPSLLFNYSKALDYSIQVQLTNISKVEEFDMMEIMDRYHERQERVQEISKGIPAEAGIITR